jgi:ankyrin repeat protein
MTDIEFSKEIRLAIRQGDIDRISSLINTHPEYTNMATPFGTWLHVASRAGDLGVVKLLVDLGVDINKAGGTFEACPLKTAVSSGHYEVVEFLLSSGASVDLSEPFRNPLFSAIYNGRLDIAKLLIHHGADTTVRYTGENMNEMDAYAYAIELEQFEIAEFLVNQSRESKT